MNTLVQQSLAPTLLNQLNYPKVRQRLFLKLDPIMVTQKFELTDIGKKLPNRIYYHNDFIKSQCFLDLYREPGIFYKNVITTINHLASKSQPNCIAMIKKFQSKSKRSFSFEVQAPDFNLSSDRAEQYLLDDGSSTTSSSYFWESLAIDFIRLSHALNKIHNNNIVLANIQPKSIGFYFNRASFFDYSHALFVPKNFTFGKKADRYYLASCFVEYLVRKKISNLPLGDPNILRDIFLSFMNRQKFSRSKIDFQNRILLGLSEFHSKEEFICQLA